MSSIIQQLNWRYAVKEFDPTKKLSEHQVQMIMESMRLSPSSLGLQGWKFIRVKDTNTREALQKAAYNQPKVTQASEFFVFAVPTNFGPQNVEAFVDHTAKTRGVDKGELAGFRDMLHASVSGHANQDELTKWLKRQIYIPLGVAITVCAMEGIDTCPMEGFDAHAFDTILGLPEKNLTSVVSLAIGFRSESDQYAKFPKSRFSKEHVWIEV